MDFFIPADFADRKYGNKNGTDHKCKDEKAAFDFFAQADREKNKNAIRAYNARKKKNRSLENWNSFLIPALVILSPSNPSGTRIVISSASLCRLMVEAWIRFGFRSVYSTILLCRIHYSYVRKYENPPVYPPLRVQTKIKFPDILFIESECDAAFLCAADNAVPIRFTSFA